jgi:hypothetical protein
MCDTICATTAHTVSHFKSSCQLATTRSLGEQWRQNRCTRAAQVSLCASRFRRPSALVETPSLTTLASCLFQRTKHTQMINKIPDIPVQSSATLRFREDRYTLTYGVDCAAQKFEHSLHQFAPTCFWRRAWRPSEQLPRASLFLLGSVSGYRATKVTSLVMCKHAFAARCWAVAYSSGPTTFMMYVMRLITTTSPITKLTGRLYSPAV